MRRLSCCLSVPRDARILENFIFENLKQHMMSSSMMRV